jgi:hypothetical protein
LSMAMCEFCHAYFNGLLWQCLFVSRNIN